MSKVITSASILTVPLSLEVVCITLATAVDKFDTFVFLEKRMIIIVQQIYMVLTNLEKCKYIF